MSAAQRFVNPGHRLHVATVNSTFDEVNTVVLLGFITTPKPLDTHPTARDHAFTQVDVLPKQFCPIIVRCLLEYFACEWHHDSEDDPVDLYSELDDDRWELRKVEVFRDGRMQFADAIEHSGDTRLGEVQVPPFEAIVADPEFSPRRIDKAVFENIWRKARGGT